MPDMTFNDITPHLALPLPHPSNPLDVDVQRLRDVVSAIDAKFKGLDVLLTSDDVNLDQVQELVNAIKANTSDVIALLASKATRDELAAVIADKASRTELAAVARSTAGPALSTISYDSQGRPQQIEETVGGLPRLTTYTYNSDGTVSTVVTAFAGVTRTETYSYSGGRPTGMTATEN